MHTFDKNTLEINDIWVNRFKIDGENETQVLGIDWSCNLGFGRYELFFEENGTKIEACSEHMDTNDDKEFLRALLDKVVDMTKISG